MGMNAQSEPHVVATGNSLMKPLRYCRISTASKTLTLPLPLTSQAISCSGDSVRKPTNACRT